LFQGSGELRPSDQDRNSKGWKKKKVFPPAVAWGRVTRVSFGHGNPGGGDKKARVAKQPREMALSPVFTTPVGRPAFRTIELEDAWGAFHQPQIEKRGIKIKKENMEGLTRKQVEGPHVYTPLCTFL
jgi:hypothetical protein